MANIIHDPSLPKHWVKKTSRRCPTATYYFNVKTGISTWMHPTFREQSLKGTLPTLPSTKSSDTETLNDPLDKIGEKKVTNEDQVTSSTERTTFQEIDTSKEVKEKDKSSREIIKFVLKSKTFGESTIKQKESSSKPKKDVPIHPMLVRARKVAGKWNSPDSSKLENTKEEKKPPSETKKDALCSLDRKIVKALRRIKDDSVEITDELEENEKEEANTDTASKNNMRNKTEDLKDFLEKERRIAKARKKLQAGLKSKVKDSKKSKIFDDMKEETKRDDAFKLPPVGNKLDFKEKKTKDDISPVGNKLDFKEKKTKDDISPVVNKLDFKEKKTKDDRQPKKDPQNKETTPSKYTENILLKEVKSITNVKNLDRPPSPTIRKPSNSHLSLPDKSSLEENPVYVSAKYDVMDTPSNKLRMDRKGRSRSKDIRESIPPQKELSLQTKSTGRDKKLYDLYHDNEDKEKEILDEVVGMEVDEQEIISEIANFRGTVNQSGYRQDNTEFMTSNINKRSTSLYIVVDTNVLISDKDFVDSLRGRDVDGLEAVIVIPYTALQEMDGLKKNSSIGKACQSAISWCNSYLATKDPTVQGQSYENYMDTLAKNPKASGDDLIRDCCLFLKNDGLNICLLSDDINFRNKALMSNIPAVGMRELRSKLETTPCKKTSNKDLQISGIPDDDVQIMSSSQDFMVYMEKEDEDTSKNYPKKKPRFSTPVRPRSPKSRLNEENAKLLGNIMESLHSTLGQILEHIMVESYGDLWLSIVLHKPPWSLEEIFMCWSKHWIAVMSDRFPRDLQNLVKKIRLTLKARIEVEEDIKTLKSLVEMLYRFFRREPYRKLVVPFTPKPVGKSANTEVTKESSYSSPQSPDATMKEATTPPRISEEDRLESTVNENTEGMNNLLEMINCVGVHITHFTALILDAFGKPHTLPKLNATATMTQEGAHSSAINLHNVVMGLGTTIVKCVNETTPDSVQEFGQVLVNFWAEAKEPCPNLPFTCEDIVQTIASPFGLQCLQMTVQELEKLVNMLKSVMEGH